MVLSPSKPEASTPDRWLTLFDEFERSRSAWPGWLTALHKAGLAHFAELGIPTTSHEEWRFTNVQPVAGLPLRLAGGGTISESDLNRQAFPGLTATRLVFVDGRYAPALSAAPSTGGLARSLGADEVPLPPELRQQMARHARYDDNAFAALNTAFMEDGAVVHVAAGRVVGEPIHVMYVSTGRREHALIQPRTLIVAEPNSQVRVIEHHIGLREVTTVTNAVTEIVVGENASVEHIKVQEESGTAYHIATLATQQARSSRLLSHSISLGGLLTRNTIHCALDGVGAEAVLNGLYLGRGKQLVDHHTAIFHNQPNCPSHEYYHGILDGNSTAVFNGKIFVRPEAQKTDAKQTNRNILLSGDATVHTKPQLEIFADDVKCTHGATVGQLDEQSIFYLRARGIGLENARKMLLHAFASEIVNRITIEAVRERLDQQLFDLYER